MIEIDGEMKQITVDGKIVAEIDEEGTVWVYETKSNMDIEVRDGWPGT